MKSIFSKSLNKLLEIIGIEVHKKTANSSRHTFQGALEHIKRNGFNPKVIIDVGAAKGTHELYRIFPESRHLLIEPLEENRQYLERISQKLNNAEFIIAAATKKSGTITLNVHHDFDGSSIYLEDEPSDVNGIPRTVQSVTLDEICRDRGLIGAVPCLIKIDVQGAELDVLDGASELLEYVDFIVLEASLFGFFIGGPQIHDVITYMKAKDFVVYDILDYSYRMLDGAMSQVDIAFVKEDSIFRKYHYYATAEQREAQNKRFSAQQS